MGAAAPFWRDVVYVLCEKPANVRKLRLAMRGHDPKKLEPVVGVREALEGASTASDASARDGQDRKTSCASMTSARRRFDPRLSRLGDVADVISDRKRRRQPRRLDPEQIDQSQNAMVQRALDQK